LYVILLHKVFDLLSVTSCFLKIDPELSHTNMDEGTHIILKSYFG